MDMKYNQYKHFNLMKKRPQVLFLGNGISRQIGWKNFIENIAEKDIEKYIEKGNFQLSNLLLASAVSNVDDSERHNKYLNALTNYKYESSILIKNLLDIKFDAILTTNYTYEIEYNLDSKYNEFADSIKRDKYAKSTNQKYDSKYFIHTFNRIDTGDAVQDIWHIHGEQRRKSSLILTHDEYARLMTQIINYNKDIGNKFIHNYDDFEFKSWIDYFLMGDVYILGQGFDFSEFDLWWLLVRRQRENAQIGKMFFYEPENENKYKLFALRDLGVEIKTLGWLIDKSENACQHINEQYTEFYNDAIKDIYQKVISNREEMNNV